MEVMDAVFNVAHDYPGGAQALALAIDLNPTSFTQQVNQTGGAAFRLTTALKMTHRSGDLRILLAFALACGQMCIPLPSSLDGDPTVDECMQALSKASREFADLMQVVCSSLGDDGDISTNERSRIRDEGGQLMAALQKLLEAIDARHARGLARRLAGPG